MTGPVVILVPVLARPHRVARLLENIAGATPQPHRVLFLCDPGDQAEQDAIRVAGGEMLTPGGSYAQKINRGAAATDEPLLFLAADDLRFHDGWLPAAAALISDQVSVVGTNDLGNRRVLAGEHSTHSLVARCYLERGTIDETGKLLHEGYRHNFCDTEFIQTARARGAYAHAPDSIVEHLHPDWGKADRDRTYAKGRATFRVDRRTFARRSRLWT